jgi:tRNA(adenine34) deaminase
MVLSVFTDEYFMQEALKEAQKAFDIDEVPVGAVIVCNEQIIARAHNLTERLTDATAHAEMQAFTSASNYLGTKFLEECTLYVTIEPCAMCAGASYWTRIGKIVFGAHDPKKGFSAINPNMLHPKTKLENGLLEKECSSLMTDYFKMKRSK